MAFVLSKYIGESAWTRTIFRGLYVDCCHYEYNHFQSSIKIQMQNYNNIVLFYPLSTTTSSPITFLSSRISPSLHLSQKCPHLPLISSSLPTPLSPTPPSNSTLETKNKLLKKSERPKQKTEEKQKLSRISMKKQLMKKKVRQRC